MNTKTLHDILESMTPEELIHLAAFQVRCELDKPLKTVLNDAMGSIAKTVENMVDMISDFLEVKK
jgi:GDP-D-mannose dehydratase